jgi:hypothetical protein
MARTLYTRSKRLSDVLALIQVLALDKATHRSEIGISDELQGGLHLLHRGQFWLENIQSFSGLARKETTFCPWWRDTSCRRTKMGFVYCRRISLTDSFRPRSICMIER